MDATPRTGGGADGDGWEDTLFIEGASSSDDELEFDIGDNKHRRTSSKQRAALSVERSPPLLLAFSITSGPKVRDDSPSPASSLGAQAEEEAIEEWMILGRGDEPGDSSIHLNLSYWNNSEEDSSDEGEPILDGALGMHDRFTMNNIGLFNHFISFQICLKRIYHPF